MASSWYFLHRGSILAVGDDCFTPEVIKMWFIRNLKLILLEGDEN